MSSETKVETNVKQAVPMFWVRDIQASLRFYIDGLGFKITQQWVHEGQLRWCWLELGNAALMLQEFWKEGQHRNLPDQKVGIGVGMCFICQDAISLYRDFVSRGIKPQRPFVGNGMWDVQLVDPDGYRLSFQSPTDTPEDTEYSGSTD